jgi:hypothetical protein
MTAPERDTATPSTGRRSAVVVVAVVAAAVVGVALVTGNGGGRRDDSVIALNVPAGWVVSSDGTVAAESQADLTATEPAGAVVRGEIVGRAGGGAAGVVQELSAPVEDGEFAFEEPLSQSLQGSRAVSIQTRAAGRVRTFIAVHPKGQDAVVFTLDAPLDRYEALRATLARIPGLSRA